MPEPQFCRACGARLIVTLGKVDHHDWETGKPIFEAWLRCPHKRQRWNFFDPHDAHRGSATEGGGFVRQVANWP